MQFTKIQAPALAATLAVTLAAGPALAENFKRILTEADYRATVVDKKITRGSGFFIVHGDGRLTGSIPQGPLAGDWNWEKTFFCRSITINNDPAGSKCQVIKVSPDGKTLMIIGDEGKDPAKTYTIN